MASIPEHFSSYEREFYALAEVCQRVGASAVRLLEGETLIAALPAQATPTESSLTVSAAGLTLQVDGLSGEPWQSTAATLLGLFARLLTSEAELESLTAALIETQDRLVALYDLSNATRRTLEIPTLLDLLLRETSRLLQVGSAFAALTKPGQRSIIRQYGENPLPEAQIYAALSLYQRNPQQHTLQNADTLPTALQNVTMVSIPVHDGTFAALGVRSQRESLTAPDIKLIKALAQQTGAQLENALLVQEALARTRLETEMDLARKVQMALLPQSIPTPPGLDLYATSSPALEVGGDFFDVVSAPQDSFTFLLGDVTGKGMPAALLMTMTRTVAHSAAHKMPFNAPHQLMKRLNDDLLEDFSTVGMFTTAFVGVFNPLTRSLSYCNAGQSPILYLPAAGQPILLEAQDIPVGIFSEYAFTSYTMALSAGDILIAASDGFPESRSQTGEMFGYERMKTILQENRIASARQMVDALFSAVNQFSNGHPQDDDRTIIAIKIL
jgi:sigma-B regulation protein RsbU (phosphoserine phosphatase)